MVKFLSFRRGRAWGDAGKPGGGAFCRNGWAGGVLRELATAGRGGFPIRHGQGQGTVFEVRVVGHLGQHLDLRREGDGLIGGGKLHLQYRFVFPKGVAVDLDGVPLVGERPTHLVKRRRTGLHLPQQRFVLAWGDLLFQLGTDEAGFLRFFGEDTAYLPSEGIGGLAHAALPAGAGGEVTLHQAGNGEIFPAAQPGFGWHFDAEFAFDLQGHGNTSFLPLMIAQGEGLCKGRGGAGGVCAGGRRGPQARRRSRRCGRSPHKPPGGRLGLRPMLGFGRNKKRGSSRRDCPFDASIIQRQ